MPLSLKPPVFSLSRFFHKAKKREKINWPCWLAGRFYPKNKNHYELRSQNHSLLFKMEGDMSQIKTGDWLAVRLHFKKGDIYQAKERVLLSLAPSFGGRESFSYAEKGSVLQQWRLFLKAIQDFFCSKGVAYAETPSLVACPGTEPHLQAFETCLNIHKQSKKVYLPTSPEMHLKRLLCQDWTDFFEIKRCYRQGELSRHHQPEMTLLEWYRAFYFLPELIRECYHLLVFLKKKLFLKASVPPFKIFTMRDLFKKYLNFSLHPQTSKKELLFLLKAHNLPGQLKDSFEDLFFLIFLNKIEPRLPKQSPVFICDYPPQLRAFARIKDGGWADRFELYWRGMELANGFYEVIDPKEQKKLFQQHLKQRRDSVPLDKGLLKLMERGMPPASGVALGLDRLFLAFCQKEDLKEIRLFPL